NAQRTDETPVVSSPPEASPIPPTPASTRRTRIARALRGPAALDVAICAVITLYAGWLTSGLWPDPAGRALALNPGDQALDEWFLALGTRLYSGDFHLVTPLLNAPDGVNLLGNASLILLGVVMAPVTLAFGAPVSFAVIMAANFGATVGAAFTAFAPGMVSQANAHLHMTAQWLVPVMVWCVLRLTGERRFW